MTYGRVAVSEDPLDATTPGRVPLAFTQFVVKTHTRCNLACDYCYVYEMADQSWRNKPSLISRDVVRQTARKIGEHSTKHGLSSVQIVLHGGEPLLAGADHLTFMATEFRTQAPPATKVEICLQTNGTLLAPPLIDVLAEHGIGISVSVDGAAPDHDRHRRYRDGRGSFRAVAAGLELLRTSPLYRGLLCTVNVQHDPLRTYETLISFGPPRIDLLLPHGNWSQPPPGRRSDRTTPYADWLCTVFDRWYDSPEPETEIRIFAEIIHLLLGGRSGVETIGLTPSTLIVIETDGSIEQVDALKSAYDGAATTGFHVMDHDFDEVARHPDILARQGGASALARSCQECRLLRVCGGGYYPHRYLEGNGFANPSVYCADLQALIDHIRGRLAADLSGLRGD